ncbi:hypothetical protein H2200_010728 [Cladophialophora chaetospira]|uniref:Uncharacterized protein n=1 Tax=Cladophialophora chaetospira TaxID=386627 RepID=A0AA38X0N4_9EURO|nr:hypothetical protein H2200_010728 [Cladophialophora chaetospira]
MSSGPELGSGEAAMATLPQRLGALDLVQQQRIEDDERRMELRRQLRADLVSLIEKDVENPGPENERQWKEMLEIGKARESEWTRLDQMDRLRYDAEEGWKQDLLDVGETIEMYCQAHRRYWSERTRVRAQEVDRDDDQQDNGDGDADSANEEADPVEQMLLQSPYQEPTECLPRRYSPASVRILQELYYRGFHRRIEYYDDYCWVYFHEASHIFATWSPWPVWMRRQLVNVSEKARRQIENQPTLRNKYIYMLTEAVEDMSAGSYQSLTISRHTSLDDALVSALNHIDQQHLWMVQLAYVRRYHRSLRCGPYDYEDGGDLFFLERVVVNRLVRSKDELRGARVAWWISSLGTLHVSGYDWQKDEFVQVEVLRHRIR